MAARIKAQHQDAIRAKIQADRLLAWLQAGIFGTKFQGKDVVLTSDKVSAVRTLLNKRLPDLSAVTLSGDKDKPITFAEVPWLKTRSL